MQNYTNKIEYANMMQHIFVKDGERPTIKSLFEALSIGSTLHINYERRLHDAIKSECFRQNEIARAIGGELNLYYRTARKGDEILIYRLK